MANNSAEPFLRKNSPAWSAFDRRPVPDPATMSAGPGSPASSRAMESTPPQNRANEVVPTRVERSCPDALWQIDIFSSHLERFVGSNLMQSEDGTGFNDRGRKKTLLVA